MRRGAANAAQLAVLVLALGSLLGAPCGGTQNRTWVSLEASPGSVGTRSPLVVEVLVSSPTPVQAFDLGLRWDPQMLKAFLVLPHPEFDDDGIFFTNPSWDYAAGRLEGVVDLRHGGEGSEGTFKVATLWFMSRDGTGPTELRPTYRGIADADGNEPKVSTLPLTITIEP